MPVDHLELVVQALAIGPGGVGLLLRRQARLVDLGRRRASRPASALARSSSTSLRPAAVGKAGRIGARLGTMKAQRLAIARRVVDRLGQVGEQLDHLGRALEAVLGRQPAALGLRDLGAVGDAQQDVVRLVLLGIDEVDVVGRDQRQVVRQRDLDQRGLDPLLVVQAVAHQLDVEAAGEERPRAVSTSASARSRLPASSGSADRPFGAAGERDQALARPARDRRARARAWRPDRLADGPGSTAAADCRSPPRSGPGPAAGPAPAAGRCRAGSSLAIGSRQPTSGWTPARAALWLNSQRANRLARSVIATAGAWSCRQRSSSRSSRTVLSSSE